MDQDPGQKTGFLITGEDAEKVTANRIRVGLELVGLKQFDIAVVPVPGSDELAVPEEQAEQALEYESANLGEQKPKPVNEVIQRGELYDRLVDLSRVPDIEAAGDYVADIAFLGDSTISFNNRILMLKPHELFTFNALLLNRHRPVGVDDLLEMGYFPDSANSSSRYGSFSAVKNRLKARLQVYSGRSLIKERNVLGSHAKTYQFDPEIRLALTDLRRES